MSTKTGEINKITGFAHTALVIVGLLGWVTGILSHVHDKTEFSKLLILLLVGYFLVGSLVSAYMINKITLNKTKSIDSRIVESFYAVLILFTLPGIIALFISPSAISTLSGVIMMFVAITIVTTRILHDNNPHTPTQRQEDTINDN